MSNRTIKFYGRAYGTEPCAMTINCNGATVFSGEVPTVILKPGQRAPVPVPNMNKEVDTVELCSFDIVKTVTGLVPMTIEVTAGSVLLGEVMSNYMMILNPAYSIDQLAKLGHPASTDTDKLTIYNAVAVPPLSLAEKTALMNPAILDTDKDPILSAHGCDVMISTGANFAATQYEVRHNVTIDGVPQTPDTTDFTGGTWWWMLQAGSTMTCNFEVPSDS